ncbi:MAG: MMPL family transporter, partial [Acidimicrobiia bacterium]
TTALTRRLPVLMAVVIGLSFLLLLVVFRSVLVPLKAAAMNLLSIGASYGVIVAVFQWGWGGELIGVDRTGPIQSFAPMMLFAVLFGLSMDYEVFLISRIREEYLRTGDNAVAVADGLANTARVITAAAAIMITVFASFLFNPDTILKLFGLGLATAILIDATIVRTVLVPATMELLGDRNWWFPSWLDRIVPRVAVEAPEHEKGPAEGTRTALDLAHVGAADRGDAEDPVMAGSR